LARPPGVLAAGYFAVFEYTVGGGIASTRPGRRGAGDRGGSLVKVNLVCSLDVCGRAALRQQLILPIRPDLLALFDVAELKVHDRRRTGRATRRRRDLR
jgi:hypothetical protein